MKAEPFVIIENLDDGTILDARVRETEEEAIDVAVEVIRVGDEFKDLDLIEVRKKLVDDSI